jgi:protein-disulfide isomerase
MPWTDALDMSLGEQKSSFEAGRAPLAVRADHPFRAAPWLLVIACCKVRWCRTFDPHLRSRRLNCFRHALIASSIILAAFGSPSFASRAEAQSAIAAALARPVSLPEIAIGSAKAPVTVTEYASMSCPHCAAFGENVFPMLRSKYIDTGKVRFVFREFPLDIKAAAASMLARCIARDDSEKYLAAVELLFKQLERLMDQTRETLKFVGRLNGMSEQEVETCEKDQGLLDKLAADQRYALETLKVDSTPTFFVNGERLKGAMSFEELEERLKPLLKR